MKKKGKFIRSYHGQERTEYPIIVLFHSSLLVIDGEHSGGCDWANALRRRVGVKMASLAHLTYLFLCRRRPSPSNFGGASKPPLDADPADPITVQSDLVYRPPHSHATKILSL